MFLISTKKSDLQSTKITISVHDVLRYVLAAKNLRIISPVLSMNINEAGVLGQWPETT